MNVSESAIIHTQWMKLNLTPKKSILLHLQYVLWAFYCYQRSLDNEIKSFILSIQNAHAYTISKYKMVK